MRYLIALTLTLAAVGAVALADCRVVQIRSHRAATVVVDHHAAYSYYSAPYSVGYAPDLTEVVKLLLEDNKQMREALIQQLRAAPGAVLPSKESPIGLRTLQTRCATCHDATVAKAKGGGKTLFDAKGFLDTPENVGAVVSAIREGRMPKGGKMSPEDKYETLFFLAVKE